MRKGRFLKGVFMVLGAIAFSTLGIFASDSIRGIDRNIASLGGARSAVNCPSGMITAYAAGAQLCVDLYEASPSQKCPNQNPRSAVQSEQNINTPQCYPTITKGAIPWSFISLPQAQRACAAAGKRLPTSAEWYAVALGTDIGTCLTNAQAPRPAGDAGCISSVGVHDLIGNVWEWVNETVNGYSFNGRQLPEEGYVSSVDASGIAITSAASPDALYGEDYFWAKPEGVFGMIRGGFYGSGSDAGLYAVNVSIDTGFATQGIGFRCVKDVF